MTDQKEYYCKNCGAKISEEKYESNDGLCSDCYEDSLAEEIDTSTEEDDLVPM